MQDLKKKKILTLQARQCFFFLSNDFSTVVRDFTYIATENS